MGEQKPKMVEGMESAWSDTHFEMRGMIKGIALAVAKERGWPPADEDARENIRGEAVIFSGQDMGTLKKLDTQAGKKIIGDDTDLDGIGLALTKSGHVLIGGDNFVWPVSRHTTETTIFELTEEEQDMVVSILKQHEKHSKFANR